MIEIIDFICKKIVMLICVFLTFMVGKEHFKLQELEKAAEVEIMADDLEVEVPKSEK